MVVEIVIGGVVLVGGIALFRVMNSLENNDGPAPVTMIVSPDTDVTQHFHWLTPTLALGDFRASVPPQCWEHFDAILNVSMSAHDNIESVEGAGIYKHIGFPDRENGPFEATLPACLEHLEQLQREGKKTLVHCMAGASRSASVVAAYLQKHYFPTEEITTVFAEMKKRRHQVDPYPGFVTYLHQRENP